jgi:DNA-directed RNA polymerase subunit RPC12/RpoP
MEQWYCFECKKEMMEADVTLSYLEISRAVKGIKCPSCKAAYLLEQTVEDVVRKGEEKIENK